MARTGKARGGDAGLRLVDWRGPVRDAGPALVPVPVCRSVRAWGCI